jgi:hypothetical protein
MLGVKHGGGPMPFVTKEFYHRERGVDNMDRYSLARDRGTGRVFIFHEWSRHRGSSPATGTNEIELGVFLGGSGAAQDRLHTLIGTLVEED